MKEETLLEGKIERKEKPTKAFIELTNQRLLLKKEKGLFKKRMMIFDEIELNKISKENKKALITNNNQNINITTKDGVIEFTCKEKEIANKLVELIHEKVDEPTVVEKGKDSIKKIVKAINDNPESVEAAKNIVTGFITLAKNLRGK